MKKEELVELIGSWENLDYLTNEISKSELLYKMLMDIALYDTNSKSWRAAYLADKINDKHPELLEPFFREMIVKVRTEKNESKKRHFLKLISMNDIPAENQGPLFDFCLNTFSSDKAAIAVRVHAMQILFNIAEKEPELKPEIISVIEHEIENHPTAGIVSRGRKLLMQLKEHDLVKKGKR